MYKWSKGLNVLWGVGGLLRNDCAAATLGEFHFVATCWLIFTIQETSLSENQY